MEREGEKIKKKIKENKDDELLREMTRIKDEVGFKFSRIQDDIATGEQSIRTEIKLKDEDIELLKKVICVLKNLNLILYLNTILLKEHTVKP